MIVAITIYNAAAGLQFTCPETLKCMQSIGIAHSSMAHDTKNVYVNVMKRIKTISQEGFMHKIGFLRNSGKNIHFSTH